VATRDGTLPVTGYGVTVYGEAQRPAGYAGCLRRVLSLYCDAPVHASSDLERFTGD